MPRINHTLCKVKCCEQDNGKVVRRKGEGEEALWIAVTLYICINSGGLKIVVLNHRFVIYFI